MHTVHLPHRVAEFGGVRGVDLSFHLLAGRKVVVWRKDLKLTETDVV